MTDFSKELRFARRIARNAGAILQEAAGGRHQVRLKGRVDLVTEIDLKSEKYIVAEIGIAFPDHSILAEEGGESGNGSRFRWIIDPLDGTTNYAHGYPAYCVSIGLENNGEMVLGAIYNPVLDEMFSAVVDGGSFLNDKPIAVSEESDLSCSLLATGFPYDIADSKIDNLDNFGRMYKDSRGIRRGGSAALDICYLACGRFDGFWELKLHPWDSAAGLVIAREAGAQVTAIDGSPYSIYDKGILASNGYIHKQMQAVLLQNSL